MFTLAWNGYKEPPKESLRKKKDEKLPSQSVEPPSTPAEPAPAATPPISVVHNHQV
jgi:hypothetical protein